MILTLLPNPALDKTVVVSGFEVGEIYRPGEVLTLAGGKGFNFARALHGLGGEALVVAPLGGHLGQYFLELAEKDGLRCDHQPILGALRTCLTIVDPAAGYRLTELYEKGTPLQSGEWEQLVTRTVSHFPEAQFLVVCGSFPPGVPGDGLAALLKEAGQAGLPVILDTYGEPLKTALSFSPALVKINQHEASDATGLPVTNPSEALAAAAELQKRGARQVVITLGKQGAVGLSANGQGFSQPAPSVKAISPVGSGDALLAGVVSGLAQGWNLPQAVRLGVAVAAANTLQLGAGRFDNKDLALAELELERLVP